MLAKDDPLIPDFQKADPHTGALFTAHSHHDTYDAIDPRKLDFAGKAVFITGASRGIGRSIAVAYAQAGASYLALAARGSMDETVAAVQAAAAAAGRPPPRVVLPLVVDTTDPAAVQAAADQTAAAFAARGGGVDVVVNNAAVLEPAARVADSDAAGWWRTLETNVRGVHLVSRALLPLLLRAAPPEASSSSSSPSPSPSPRTLVNLTSIGGLLVLDGLSAYNTSKLAVCRLTEHLALEYAAQGLVALAVHPGGVASDMGRQLPPQFHASLTETPALVADTIAYLTRAPQHWLSGRYVSVLWDMPELEAQKDAIVAKDLLKNKLLV